MNNSTGCIPDTGFFRYTQGYNAVADPLLEKRFGSDYMTHVKEEVARRMNII